MACRNFSTASVLSCLSPIRRLVFQMCLRTSFQDYCLGQLLDEERHVYFTRAKERLVLSEADPSQPTPDIHGRNSEGPNGSSVGRSALSRAGLLMGFPRPTA
jgi:hypothetical protein